jgi:hypothetical protein
MGSTIPFAALQHNFVVGPIRAKLPPTRATLQKPIQPSPPAACQVSVLCRLGKENKRTNEGVPAKDAKLE